MLPKSLFYSKSCLWWYNLSLNWILLHFFDYMLQKLSACYLPLIGTPSLSSIGIHLSASLRITNNHSPVRVACLKSTKRRQAAAFFQYLWLVWVTTQLDYTQNQEEDKQGKRSFCSRNGVIIWSDLERLLFYFHNYSILWKISHFFAKS